MSIAYRSGSTTGNGAGTSLSISKPAGTVDNDILILLVYREAGTVTVPAGFTQIGSDVRDTGNNMYLSVYWKRAASEGTSYSITFSTSTWVIAAMGAFSGCLTSGSPVDVFASNNGGANTVVGASITTTAANVMRVVAMGNFDGSDIGAGTSAYTQGAQLGGLEIWYSLQAVAGASGAKSFTDNSTSAWATMHVALKEAAASTNYNRGFSSSVSHTASVARTASHPRAASSSISPSATTARSTAASRQVSSSIGSSASVTNGNTRLRAVVSSIAHAASVARAQALTRVASSSIASSPTVARVVGRIRSVASSIAASATVGRLQTLTRTVASSIANTASVVRSGGTQNYEISAGSGYTDVSPKQLVRTSGNRLYVFAVDCGSYPCTATSQTIRAYKADQNGVPAAFSRMDSTHEPSGIAAWAVAIDGSDVVHVLWAERTTNGGVAANLKYRTFDTATDTWSATTETVASSMNTSNDGQGDQLCAIALDSGGTPHIVYVQGNGNARRIYYRNRTGGTWSAATQLDSGLSDYTGNRKAWHPNLAFDSTGRIIAAWEVGAFNGDSDGKIFVKVRSAGGSWGSNVQIASSLYVGIDQSTSLLVTPDDRMHITFILPETVVGAVQISYIQYYYSDDHGATWSANHPGGGTQATHNPALGYAKGKVRIYGHGTPDSGAHGQNLYYFEGDGGSATWGSWTLFVTGTNYDSSINVRWSQFFHNYNGTIDLAYWNDNYPNNLYVGTAVLGSGLVRAISSSIAHTLTLARQGAHPRALAASLSHTAAIIRQAGSGRAITTSTGQSATISRQTSAGRSLSASTSAAASIARQVVVSRVLSAGAVVSSTVSRLLGAARGLTAGTAHTAGIGRVADHPRTLSAALSHAAAVTRASSVARSLSVALSHAQSVARSTGVTRAVAGAVSIVASVSRQASTGRTMSVAPGAPVATVQRLAARARAVASTVGHSTSAARSLVLTRAVSASQAVAASMTGVRQGAGAYARSLASNIGHTASVTRQLVQQRAVSATTTITATVVAGSSLARGIAISLVNSASAARQVAAGRAVAASTSVAAGVTRAVSVARSLGVLLSPTVLVSRSTAASRNIASSIAAGASVVQSRTTGLVRSIGSTIQHTADLARAVTSSRGVTSSISINVLVKRAGTFTRTAAMHIAHAVAMLAGEPVSAPPRALAPSRVTLLSARSEVTLMNEHTGVTLVDTEE